MNPLVQARHKRGLSQQDISTITGYTRQLIQRYESGRSNKPPLGLCAYYDEATDQPIGTHAELYTDWIKERRLRLPLSELKHILSGYSALRDRVEPVVPNRALHQMRTRIEYQSDVRPEDLDGNKKTNASDTYFVCATMHLHPYSIQKWQQTGKIPAVLIEIVNMKQEVSNGQSA